MVKTNSFNLIRGTCSSGYLILHCCTSRDLRKFNMEEKKRHSSEKLNGVKYKDVDTADPVELKAKITLLNGITIIVGSIVGSGIFVSPKGVLERTESIGLALVVWLLGGVFSLIGSHCFSELGCAIQKSGADYAYIYEAFGPFLAFLRLWVECMIVRPCSCAVVALTFSYYIIEPLFPGCEQPLVAVSLLAAICISK